MVREFVPCLLKGRSRGVEMDGRVLRVDHPFENVADENESSCDAFS